MEFITHTLASGAELRFASLTLYDIFGNPKDSKPNGIIPGYRRTLKSQLLETLKMAEASMEQIVSELANFDKSPASFDTLIEFVNTPTGVTAIIDHAWALANPGAEHPPFAGEFNAIRDKVFDPIGLVFNVTKDADAGDKETSTATYGDGSADPNPTTPPTYSATPDAPAGPMNTSSASA